MDMRARMLGTTLVAAGGGSDSDQKPEHEAMSALIEIAVRGIDSGDYASISKLDKWLSDNFEWLIRLNTYEQERVIKSHIKLTKATE